MAKQSKKIGQKMAKQPYLTAHGLLGSISYWGSAARLIVAAVLIGFAFLLNISGATTAASFDSEIIFLIYGLGTVFILDVGYVMAARALPLNAVFDRWVVLLGDLLVAAVFVVPSLFVAGTYSIRIRVLSLLVALLFVSIRILLGLVLSKPASKRKK